MGSKLVEVGAALDVGRDDLREIKRQRRRHRLTAIAQVFAPLASATIGILAAEEAYPIEPRLPSGYPYATAPLFVATAGRTYYGRRSWVGPIILSVVLFIVTFVFVALFNTAANDRPVLRYGVYPGRTSPGD